MFDFYLPIIIGHKGILYHPCISPGALIIMNYAFIGQMMLELPGLTGKMAELLRWRPETLWKQPALEPFLLQLLEPVAQKLPGLPVKIRLLLLPSFRLPLPGLLFAEQSARKKKAGFFGPP